jgi:hypothetical protein
MLVMVDGKELIRSVDNTYRNPFHGVTIINHGGDYAISNVQIHGIAQ